MSDSETYQSLPETASMVGFAEFAIGPAGDWTRWLTPPYDSTGLAKRAAAI